MEFELIRYSTFDIQHNSTLMKLRTKAHIFGSTPYFYRAQYHLYTKYIVSPALKASNN